MIDSHNIINIVNKTVDMSNFNTIIAGEQNSELATFKIDRYYDNEDLSLKTVQLIYKNASGTHLPETLTISKVTDKEVYISWKLSAQICLTSGITLACLCFISDNYALKTKNFKFTVESSIDPSSVSNPPENNWYVTIEGKIADFEKKYILKTDIADWAKQPEKPNYTASEVGAEPLGSNNNILQQALKYADAILSDFNVTTAAINQNVDKNTKNIEKNKTIINQNTENIKINTNAINILNGSDVGSVKRTINDAIKKENLSQYATNNEMTNTNEKVKVIEDTYCKIHTTTREFFPENGNSKDLYIDKNIKDIYIFNDSKYIRLNESKYPDIIDNVLIIKS